MAVAVVDLLEMVEVDQGQAMHLPRRQHGQLIGRQGQKVAAIEQPGQLIGGGQAFQLAHHPAQGVLVRLQGEAALAHALAQGLQVAGE